MNDSDERNTALRLLGVIVGLLILLVVAGAMAWPILGEFASAQLSPGVGLKDAAVLSFFLTVLVMVVFAIAAGDGFIGEIQFMLAGFFSFFVVMWLLIAWIF